MRIVKKDASDFRLYLKWRFPMAGSVEIEYAEDKEKVRKASVRVSRNGVDLILRTPDKDQIIKHNDAVPKEDMTLIRRGNFTRVLFDRHELVFRGAVGEWEGVFTARKADCVIIAENCDLISCDYSPLTWLEPMEGPLIGSGEAGTYYEQQIIPGALLDYHDTWYMYTMAGRKGCEEGCSKRTVGLCKSTDLIHWTVSDAPILTSGDLNLPNDNLYPNACILRQDGKIVLLITAQLFPDWIGLCAFIADHPEGPFRAFEGNPVIRPESLFHEFDVVRCDMPQGKYMLYLATFTNEENGSAGDRGIRWFSDDLLHWTRDSDPSTIFKPETKEGWDSAHVRPRGMNRIADTWYVWYEGTSCWVPPEHNKDDLAFVNWNWFDTVGLARTKDFSTWEYYPLNPCINPGGISPERYDSTWTGWPRMIIKNKMCYVFHSASGKTVSVGLRKIPLDTLTDWTSELRNTEHLCPEKEN